MHLRGLSRDWAEHRGHSPVHWQHCSPSWAVCVWQQGMLSMFGAHLRLMNSSRERFSVCSDLGLSCLSMSSLFLQPLSFPLTTWGHTKDCHCTHHPTASPVLAFPLPDHDTQQPMMLLPLAIPACAQLPTGFPTGLAAPRHSSVLQSFPTSPDSSGSHFTNAKLCHSPGTAHTNSGGANLCRESWIPLGGWFCAPELLLPLCEGTGTGTQGGTQLDSQQHSFGHYLGWR